MSHDSLTPKASFLKNRDSLESVRICFAFSSFSIFFCVILRPGTWPKGLTLKKTKNQNRGPSLCSGRQLLKTRFPPYGDAPSASLGCCAIAIAVLRTTKNKVSGRQRVVILRPGVWPKDLGLALVCHPEERSDEGSRVEVFPEPRADPSPPGTRSLRSG